MKTRPQLRLALVGPSRVGKTTTCRVLETVLHPAVRISVARPLYSIQEFLYELVGKPGGPETAGQDGELLQIARQALLHVDSHALECLFKDAVLRIPDGTTVINDDVRLAMKPVLEDLDFKFVYVRGPIRSRVDITEPSNIGDPHDALIEPSACDFAIDNEGSMADLVENVKQFMNELC